MVSEQLGAFGGAIGFPEFFAAAAIIGAKVEFIPLQRETCYSRRAGTVRDVLHQPGAFPRAI